MTFTLLVENRKITKLSINQNYEEGIINPKWTFKFWFQTETDWSPKSDPQNSKELISETAFRGIFQRPWTFDESNDKLSRKTDVKYFMTFQTLKKKPQLLLSPHLLNSLCQLWHKEVWQDQDANSFIFAVSKLRLDRPSGTCNLHDELWLSDQYHYNMQWRAKSASSTVKAEINSYNSSQVFCAYELYAIRQACVSFPCLETHRTGKKSSRSF